MLGDGRLTDCGCLAIGGRKHPLATLSAWSRLRNIGTYPSAPWWNSPPGSSGTGVPDDQENPGIAIRKMPIINFGGRGTIQVEGHTGLESGGPLPSHGATPRAGMSHCRQGQVSHGFHGVFAG
jgi:hypothetical protein